MTIKPLAVSACLLLGCLASAATPAWKTNLRRDGFQIMRLAVANDGSVLATLWPQTRRVIMLDGRTGKVLWRRRTHRGSAKSLSISADGESAVYMDVEPDDYDFRGILYLMDRRGRVHLARYTRGPAAISPGGGRVAIHSIAGDSGVGWGMKLLDRRGRTLWRRPEGVEHLEFSPNGKYVFTEGSGGSVWSADGRRVWRLARGHLPSASDSGRTLAMLDNTLQFVNRSRRGAEEHTVTADRLREGWWATEATNPAVSQNGKLIVAAQVAFKRFRDVVGPDHYLLRAFTPNGKSRWNAALPSFLGDSIDVHSLGQDGFVALVRGSDGATVCYTVNHLGKVRTFLQLFQRVPHGVPCSLSPDGRKLALAVGSELRLYSIAAL